MTAPDHALPNQKILLAPGVHTCRAIKAINRAMRQGQQSLRKLAKRFGLG